MRALPRYRPSLELCVTSRASRRRACKLLAHHFLPEAVASRTRATMNRAVKSFSAYLEMRFVCYCTDLPRIRFNSSRSEFTPARANSQRRWHASTPSIKTTKPWRLSTSDPVQKQLWYSITLPNPS